MGKTFKKLQLKKDFVKFEKAQKLRNNGEIKEANRIYSRLRKENMESDPDFATECLHLIGVGYYQERKYQKAEKVFREAQEEFEMDDNDESVGFVLRNRGMNARSNKDLKLAREFLQESIKRLVKAGNKGHEGISRVKLGRVFADEGDFKNALKEINKGMKLLADGKEKFFWSSSYLDRAKVHLQMGEKKKARNDAQESLRILNSLYKESEFLMRRKDIDEVLSRINEE